MPSTQLQTDPQMALSLEYMYRGSPQGLLSQGRQRGFDEVSDLWFREGTLDFLGVRSKAACGPLSPARMPRMNWNLQGARRGIGAGGL